MNKSVKTFDELDHHYTPEQHLHQIDSYMIFTTEEHPLDLVANYEWHKQL